MIRVNAQLLQQIDKVFYVRQVTCVCVCVLRGRPVVARDDERKRGRSEHIYMDIFCVYEERNDELGKQLAQADAFDENKFSLLTLFRFLSYVLFVCTSLVVHGSKFIYRQDLILRFVCSTCRFILFLFFSILLTHIL